MLWVTVAMVGARTLAMALNRLVDAELNAANPRTAAREVPSGLLTRTQVLALCAAALAVFLFAVFRLDPVVRWLWPIPVAMFFVYPYLKRFTWLSHLWLGACLGLAPVGAWLAARLRRRGKPGRRRAVLLWVAGFDLFYSLYDVEHDREQGLHSWAARFGERGVSTGPAPFTQARSCSSRWRAPASTSGCGTGPGSPRWPDFSPTSTPREARRSPPPRCRVLHGERRDQRRVPRLRLAGLPPRMIRAKTREALPVSAASSVGSTSISRGRGFSW